MRWTGRVARIGETRHICSRKTWREETAGISSRRCEDNIRMDLRRVAICGPDASDSQ